MPDQVPQKIKHERAAKLIELGNKLEAQYAKEMIGTIEDVLFETEEDGLCEGYTPRYVRVRADGQCGRVQKVLITSTEGALAVGRVVE